MELEKLLISPKSTIKDALKQIDSGAEKILFVVDENKKLIGALTDGDIRRHILKGGGLQDTIEGCYNKQPLCLSEGHGPEEAKAMMVKHKIEVIPIVDKEGRFKDFVAWDRLLGRKTREPVDVPVVIMAGGKGTRLDPFTKILPKPLIPVGDKPMVQFIMDKFSEHGISEFFLTVNYKGEMIKSYFDNTQTDYAIKYLWEPEFLGTAGSLSLLPRDMADTFIVSNCDIIVETSYSNLTAFHHKNNNLLTVVGSIQHYKIPYGILEHEEGGALKKIVEKPEYDLLVNTGLYVLGREALGYVPQGEFFNMTDLINRLLAEGKKVGVYPVSEKSYVDMGQWEEYKKNIQRSMFD